MKVPFDAHLFWGAHSPLSTLAGGSLLILASSRFSFALVCVGSLLWVYCLTVLAIFAARPILPKRGKQGILVFLSTIIGSFYLFFLWFMSPLLVLDTFFFLILSPVCFIASGLMERIWPSDSGEMDIKEVLVRSFSEAAALGVLILALSLIREPIGFAVLSFPEGARGIAAFFGAEEEGFFPVRIATSSAGALILLGYGIALFKRLREQYFHKEEY
ncbi:hypothetical protein FACS189479_07590 [Spirochaetia bacterium]|nr:hypothetical protein FACS189479_07590 [Spirochaetia bacterium]